MSNLPGNRLSGNFVCYNIRINCHHGRNLESYDINQSAKQKKSCFSQVIGQSGLFYHLRPAEHLDSMY